jgi:hypothetical protein
MFTQAFARGYQWPVMIVGLLVLGVVANVGILLKGIEAKDDAVEPDYYRKAVNWDASQAALAKSRQLGWKVDLTPSVVESATGAAATPGVGQVTVRGSLLDDAAAPIDGAKVVIEAFSIRKSGQRTTVEATTAGGRFTAELPHTASGLWEFRVRATHGNDTYTEVLRRELH